MSPCIFAYRLAIPAVVALTAASCSPTRIGPDAAQTTTAVIEAFFDTYADRDDFEAFLEFYAEDAVVEDLVNGDLVEGREAIGRFFDWDSGRVSRTEERALVVDTLVVEGRTAVARGHFTPFQFDGRPLGPWRFVIWLELDESGKILKQEDFINYPSALLDPERPSSNDRVPRSPPG